MTDTLLAKKKAVLTLGDEAGAASGTRRCARLADADAREYDHAFYTRAAGRTWRDILESTGISQQRVSSYVFDALAKLAECGRVVRRRLRGGTIHYDRFCRLGAGRSQFEPTQRWAVGAICCRRGR